MDEQDEGATVGLWVVLGIITLLLFGLIGGLVIRTMNAKHAAKPVAVAATAAAAPAASAVAEADVLIDVPLAGVVLVRVFFELDKSELQPDASAALAPAVKALADAPGKKLVIAGFHDPSGDPAHNAELAKQRARRCALRSLRKVGPGPGAAAQARADRAGRPGRRSAPRRSAAGRLIRATQ